MFKLLTGCHRHVIRREMGMQDEFPLSFMALMNIKCNILPFTQMNIVITYIKLKYFLNTND